MIDNETKLKIYMLIVSRYKQSISEKEQKSITEIRERCSPYNDFIKKLKERLVGEVVNYSYEQDFLHAVERILEYSRSIKNFELLIQFWMNFEEIDEIKAANTLDKAILIVALLRVFCSEKARVLVTKNKRNYAGFEYKDKRYLITPETGSLLVGEDAEKIIQNDPLAYSFSDLLFESYEE